MAAEDESDDWSHDYTEWAKDGPVLAEIGRALFSQPLDVKVRIPRKLAERTVASWEREDRGIGLPSPESPEQWRIRDRAASLSLIRLTIQRDDVEDGDDVVLPLHAWYVGNALDAADQDGFLDSFPRPPRSEWLTDPAFGSRDSLDSVETMMVEVLLFGAKPGGSTRRRASPCSLVDGLRCILRRNREDLGRGLPMDGCRTGRVPSPKDSTTT